MSKKKIKEVVAPKKRFWVTMYADESGSDSIYDTMQGVLDTVSEGDIVYEVEVVQKYKTEDVSVKLIPIK